MIPLKLTMDRLNFLKQDKETDIVESATTFKEVVNFTYKELNDIYKIENFEPIFDVIKNDSLNISIKDNYSEKIIFKNISDLKENFDKLDFDVLDESFSYSLELNITKDTEKRINIYSTDNFFEWLTSNDSLYTLFSKFELINDEKKEKIIFNILDSRELLFETDKFVFISPDQDIDIVLNYNNDILLKKQKEHCHFSDVHKIKFSPNDFYLIKRSNNDKINNFFDRICLLLTLTYICDISEILEEDKNKIFYKIHGYRSVNKNYDFNKLDTNSLFEFYKIYSWLYENSKSSISDKLGIARNLITLHIKNDDILILDDGTFYSIQSNYKIYLKENVKQYLDVKHQVSTFIYEMSLKAESYSHTFMDIFKTNFLIFISYFISIIVVTAIDKGKFMNVFSFEVSIITLIMLFISMEYKKLTVKDLSNKIERFENNYISFKNRYSGILEPDNLVELFGDDESFKNDKRYMEESLNKFSELWKNTIIVFAILTIVFCIFHDSSSIKEYLI